MYTSCEPCPLCYSTAYWARVSKVYYGAAWTDYSDLFDDSNISVDMKKPYDERAVPVEPLMRSEAQRFGSNSGKCPIAQSTDLPCGAVKALGKIVILDQFPTVRVRLGCGRPGSVSGPRRAQPRGPILWATEIQI
jgi:hypothetical protein